MPYLILPDQSEISVREVEFRHGKWQYESSGDFCGRLTRVPVKKLPDRISFHCDRQLNEGDTCQMKLKNGIDYEIIIRQVWGNKSTADILSSSTSIPETGNPE